MRVLLHAAARVISFLEGAFMEENQKDLIGQEPLPEDAVSAERAVPLTKEGASQDPPPLAGDAEETIQRADGEEPTVSSTPLFAFGENDPHERKQKKAGRILFFSVFGSVLVICLALLVLLLFVGENGIHIFRTLHSERVVFVREDDGTSGLLTPQQAADVIRKSTVTVSVKTKGNSGIGSGFVYDSNGHICTNYHVIQDAVSVQVILPDGSVCDAEVVGYDIPADLAVLRVQASGLVPVVIGSSSSLLVGDEVVAVGTPANMTLAGTATFGRVSYTRRLLPLDDDRDGIYEKKITVIQTDASVNPGNSGGPMADMYGRVVGVVVRKIEASNDRIFEGIGFAIPIDGAKVILDEIIENGRFTGENPLAEGRSLLGVTGHPGVKGKWYYVDLATNLVVASDTQAEGYHYMPVDGVYVIEVQGASARNKILVGDVILAVNGLAVRDTRDLITAVNCYPCGTTVSIRIWRGNAELTVPIVLGEG